MTASADDALAALSIDLPSWYVYSAQERRPGATATERRSCAPWRVQLQHRDGALLTPGTGETLARALWSAIEGARAVERGRAAARQVPQTGTSRMPPLRPLTQDAETACL